MNVNGKAVLLTGGSAGIGREIARQLQAKGGRHSAEALTNRATRAIEGVELIS